MEILKGTQNKVIKWVLIKVVNLKLATNEKQLGDTFEVELKGKKLVIYKVEYKSNMSILSSSGAVWDQDVRLGVVDPKDELAYWEFSSSKYSIIKDIYREIIRIESHIDDYMNDILGLNA